MFPLILVTMEIVSWRRIHNREEQRPYLSHLYCPITHSHLQHREKSNRSHIQTLSSSTEIVNSSTKRKLQHLTAVREKNKPHVDSPPPRRYRNQRCPLSPSYSTSGTSPNTNQHPSQPLQPQKGQEDFPSSKVSSGAFTGHDTRSDVFRRVPHLCSGWNEGYSSTSSSFPQIVSTSSCSNEYL